MKIVNDVIFGGLEDLCLGWGDVLVRSFGGTETCKHVCLYDYLWCGTLCSLVHGNRKPVITFFPDIKSPEECLHHTHTLCVWHPTKTISTLPPKASCTKNSLSAQLTLNPRLLGSCWLLSVTVTVYLKVKQGLHYKKQSSSNSNSSCAPNQSVLFKIITK